MDRFGVGVEVNDKALAKDHYERELRKIVSRQNAEAVEGDSEKVAIVVNEAFKRFLAESSKDE